MDEGTKEIEIAASLDPNNSLIRSYLGKAYYEQKRRGLAETEFEQAKLLDPNDPTPWFYSAIHKQTTNRPVEAPSAREQQIIAWRSLNAYLPKGKRHPCKRFVFEVKAVSSIGIGGSLTASPLPHHQA